MHLFLIGYRGSGKSTVARLLAGRLAWPCFDSDHEVESRAGKSIAAIFSDDGERAFRDLESLVIGELATGKPCVLALGGGAIMRSETRSAMRTTGKAIWLQASPETLWQRIAADQATAARRPALTAHMGLDEIKALLVERNPIYEQCADLAIDTEGKMPAQLAAEIFERFKTDLPEQA